MAVLVLDILGRALAAPGLVRGAADCRSGKLVSETVEETHAAAESTPTAECGNMHIEEALAAGSVLSAESFDVFRSDAPSLS